MNTRGLVTALFALALALSAFPQAGSAGDPTEGRSVVLPMFRTADGRLTAQPVRPARDIVGPDMVRARTRSKGSEIVGPMFRVKGGELRPARRSELGAARRGHRASPGLG